jgi:tetratricopeptide (TPR) repeat protein
MLTMTESTPCEVVAEELARFADGKLSGMPRRRILEHLLRGCASCKERLAELRHLPPEGDEADSAEVGHPDDERLGALLRDLTERRDRMETERREARQLLASFLGHPTPRQWTLLRNSTRFSTYSFTNGLIDAAFESILDDPSRAHALAEMSVDLAERIDPAPYTLRIVHDLRARALAHLANAERALGDLTSAQRTLGRARVLLDEGSLDPLLEGELDYLEASLLRGQRRLDAALRRIRSATRVFAELGEPVWWARCLANESAILSVQGDVEGSIRAARRAVEIADTGDDRRLALTARHGLVWATMESGRPAEALALLEGFRPVYRSIGDRTTLLRLSWLEARILQQLGRTDEAGAAFEATVDGFARAELPYEVASASLDWALLLAERGRTAEVARVASATLEIFRGLGVEEGVIAAWLIFQRSAQTGAVTAALVERLAAFYREARVRPGLTFTG